LARETPQTGATRFELHSLAKPLLAALLMRSVDAGDLTLDDLVGET
jgi:CubicO group peptidase (beta-lactamase class C family)